MEDTDYPITVSEIPPISQAGGFTFFNRRGNENSMENNTSADPVVKPVDSKSLKQTYLNEWLSFNSSPSLSRSHSSEQTSPHFNTTTEKDSIPTLEQERSVENNPKDIFSLLSDDSLPSIHDTTEMAAAVDENDIPADDFFLENEEYSIVAKDSFSLPSQDDLYVTLNNDLLLEGSLSPLIGAIRGNKDADDDQSSQATLPYDPEEHTQITNPYDPEDNNLATAPYDPGENSQSTVPYDPNAESQSIASYDLCAPLNDEDYDDLQITLPEEHNRGSQHEEVIPEIPNTPSKSTHEYEDEILDSILSDDLLQELDNTPLNLPQSNSTYKVQTTTCIFNHNFVKQEQDSTPITYSETTSNSHSNIFLENTPIVLDSFEEDSTEAHIALDPIILDSFEEELSEEQVDEKHQQILISNKRLYTESTSAVPDIEDEGRSSPTKLHKTDSPPEDNMNQLLVRPETKELKKSVIKQPKTLENYFLHSSAHTSFHGEEETDIGREAATPFSSSGMHEVMKKDGLNLLEPHHRRRSRFGLSKANHQ